MEIIEEQPSPDRRPLDFKEWALNIFLSGIPVVGLILLLVWAFNDSGNIHRKAWAKGMLLIYLIISVIWIFFLFVFGGIALLGADF